MSEVKRAWRRGRTRLQSQAPGDDPRGGPSPGRPASGRRAGGCGDGRRTDHHGACRRPGRTARRGRARATTGPSTCRPCAASGAEPDMGGSSRAIVVLDAGVVIVFRPRGTLCRVCLRWRQPPRGRQRAAGSTPERLARGSGQGAGHTSMDTPPPSRRQLWQARKASPWVRTPGRGGARLPAPGGGYQRRCPRIPVLFRPAPGPRRRYARCSVVLAGRSDRSPIWSRPMIGEESKAT